MIVEEPQLGIASTDRVHAGAATDSGAAPVSFGRAPIRVAFCLDSLNDTGGTELNAIRTVEAFDPALVQPVLVTLQPDGPMRARYERAGVPIHAFRTGGSLTSRTAFAEMRRLSRFFDEAGIDVVHCHDKFSNVFAGLAGRMNRRVGVITSKRWWQSPFRHELLNGIAYRASHRVLVNSAAILPTLRGLEWVPRDRVVVVPNFVDDEAFAPVSPAHVAATRARVGIPKGAHVIGCVANLHLEKDQATLVRAFASLAARHPDWHLVLVGEGSQRPVLAALARELGCEARVHMPGAIPTRERPHMLFDISALSSWHEGFPNSVVEALAAGRPVVSTSVGGVPEMVVPDETGDLVSVGDVDGMATALDRLVVSPERRATLGANARRLAETRYRRATVLPMLGQLYRTLIVPHSR